MSKFESFPTQEDWDELHEEMESDSRNPLGIARPKLRNFGPPIEPDWEALLED